MKEENNIQKVFEYQNLLDALTIKFETEVIQATEKTERLRGGTVGDVYLIKGIATFNTKEKKEYKIVLKKQKKWERFGDSLSWRREYDLYHSNLHLEFSPDFSWPICYLTKMYEDSYEIWMEYIDGPSGDKLTLEMYQKAALALGEFQGKLYLNQPKTIKLINNFSDKEYVKNFYLNYRSWNEVYDYIRLDNCELPKHLCEMMINLDSNGNKIIEQLELLPIVLCHRDYWNTNIFYNDNKIIAIDWDTTGYGYLGEDMASLIADETDPKRMLDYFKICVPAYLKGFSRYVDIKQDINKSVLNIILMMFGYRLVEAFKFSGNEIEKELAKDSLQSIYDMQKIID